MRNLILLLSLMSMTLFSSSCKSNGLNFVFTILLLILFFSAFSFSKTFNLIKNNFEDKQCRIKAANASDFSSVSDGKGGIYLFWKESSAPMESKVYFTRVNLHEESPPELIGKRVSNLSTVQNNPVSISYILNDAILAWKDYSRSYREIFLCKEFRMMNYFGRWAVFVLPVLQNKFLTIRSVQTKPEIYLFHT